MNAHTDGRTDGRKSITLDHPELHLGELIILQNASPPAAILNGVVRANIFKKIRLLIKELPMYIMKHTS